MNESTAPGRPERSLPAERVLPVERILIVRTSALGDVLHVLPSLAALRRLFPAARVSWLVEPLGASALEGHPHVDELVVMPRKRWSRALRSPLAWPRVLAEIGAFVLALRRRRFDLVLDFQCNIRSGLAVGLSGGRTRVGFARRDCREWGGALFTNLKAPEAPLLQNKVEKNLELVRALGWRGEVPAAEFPVPEADLVWARRVLDEIPGDGPIVTMHPAVSAFGALKRWPLEHFRRLAALLEDELGARVVLTWGPGEEALARSVGRGVVAPSTPRIRQLAALIKESDLFIACDTGGLHLAAILGTPILGLYGPKSPEVYGPHAARGRLLRSGVPCSPCKLRRCEHSVCMSTLFPEDVFDAAREVLASPRSCRAPA